MKVAVIGSRGLLVEDIEKYLPEGVTELVSGGARGVDRCVREYAERTDIKLTEFLPQYQRFGRCAPLKRNEEIVAYVNAHLSEDISIPLLAEHFFLSPSQFNRVFKAATGAAPWTYITAKRLTTAPQGSDPRSAERVSLLCRALSLPKKGTAVIRVLGSSGKSACATMLARALFSRGYCVGTLTTPFSHTMTECMTVNCEPVSMDCFTRNVSLVMETANSIDKQISNATNFAEEQDEALSPFEKAMNAYAKHGVPFSPFGDELLLTSALSCFSEAGCQLVIVEIPNGERAGAYRLPFPPLLNVITGADGEEDAAILCHYLDKRAKETVTALQSKEIYRIISDACAKINCRLSMPLRNS